MPKLIPHIPDGDWTALRRGLNKLTSVKIGPGASPTFTGLTLTGFSGVLKTSAGVVAGSANHGDLNDMPSSSNTNHDLRYPTRAEWLQNGFPNRTDSSISFNDGTRRFTINPSGPPASFDYFIAGVKYTISSSDVENINYVYLGDTPAEGSWYIYYDGSALIATVSPNHTAVRDIYENKAVVAIVFWDADNNKSQLLEDRHGLSMSPLTHIFVHETVGTRFDTGLALNNITTDQNGNTDSHAQFGVDAGQIFDEDIEHSLNAIGSTTGLQIWYQDTSGWTYTTNAGFSMVTTGTGRLAYDNSGTLTEVTNNYYVLCHVFATSMTHLNPVVAIGQAQYSTKKSAQQGALTEIVNILTIANISPELKPIASVIFHTNNNHSNSVKARIVSTDEGNDYVDFRTDVLNPAFSSAQNHGNLAGLTNDDHIQYLLADGTRTLAGAWDMGSQALTNVNIDSGDIHNDVTHTQWDAAHTHSGLTSGNPHSVTPTELSLVIGTNTQAWDAGLDSLAGLGYVSDSMIKITAEDTYAIRTMAEVRTDLGLVIGTDVQAFGAVLDDLNTLGVPASDGQFIVATGAGAFAYEATTTVRTSLGVGTGDSPTFAGLTIIGIDQVEQKIYSNTKGTGLRGYRARGTAGTPTKILDEDAILVLSGYGHNGTEFVGSKVVIRAQAAEDWEVGANGTEIKFDTTPIGSTTRAERVKIDDVGNTDIISHDAATIGLKLGGILVTSSAAELNLLDGVTAVQEQGDVLDDLNTLGVVGADSEFLVGTAAGALAWESGVTARASLGLTIGTDVLAEQTIGIADDNLLEVDDADAANTDYARFTANGIQGRDATEVKTDLGLVIGTNVQAYDAELTSLAALSYVAASFVKMTGANTFALRTIGETADDLQGTIDHNLTANYDANKHIDHTGVALTAGTGLTGGGDISANRTFAVDGLLEDLDTLGANGADSEFLVGTGAGALAWESGVTVRTSIGLGTGDAVQFATLGVNSSAPINGLLKMVDNAIDTVDPFYGINLSFQKIAGITDYSDGFYGIYNTIYLNQSGGTIGNYYALSNICYLSDGTIGDVTHSRNCNAIYNFLNLDNGKIYGNAQTISCIIDQEGANEITGNLCGIYVWIDADGTVGGFVCGLFLEELSNVDYGIYQDGTAMNVLGGPLKVGLKTGVDQAGAGAAAGELYVDTNDDNTVKMGV